MDPKDTGDVPAVQLYALAHLAMWRKYLHVERLTLARRSGVSKTMLFYVESGAHLLRGRKVNCVARALAIPARVLVSYSPVDSEAQTWAHQAAIAIAGERLEDMAS